jgi:hypothetical protein
VDRLKYVAVTHISIPIHMSAVSLNKSYLFCMSELLQTCCSGIAHSTCTNSRNSSLALIGGMVILI